jgi:hypothetical protein
MHAQNGNTFRTLHGVWGDQGWSGVIRGGVLQNSGTKNDAKTGTGMSICYARFFSSTKGRTQWRTQEFFRRGFNKFS